MMRKWKQWVLEALRSKRIPVGGVLILERLKPVLILEREVKNGWHFWWTSLWNPRRHVDVTSNHENSVSKINSNKIWKISAWHHVQYFASTAALHSYHIIATIIKWPHMCLTPSLCFYFILRFGLYSLSTSGYHGGMNSRHNFFKLLQVNEKVWNKQPTVIK